MPRYFIDLYDGETAVRDECGIDLDSSEEAAEQAAALLPDVARDVLPGGEAHTFAALVRDEDDVVVYRAALLFRGERKGGPDRWPAGRPSEAEDLILQSRATREATLRIAMRLQEDVRDLIDVIQDTFRLLDDVRANLRSYG